MPRNPAPRNRRRGRVSGRWHITPEQQNTSPLRPPVGALALLKRPAYSTNGALPTPKHQADICTRLTLGLRAGAGSSGRGERQRERDCPNGQSPLPPVRSDHKELEQRPNAGILSGSVSFVKARRIPSAAPGECRRRLVCCFNVVCESLGLRVDKIPIRHLALYRLTYHRHCVG